MKNLFVLLIMILNIKHISATNAEKAFDAVAQKEFQQLSQTYERNQLHVNKIRKLLKRTPTTTTIVNIEEISAIIYAINNKQCALTLALAYSGVPLFISGRNFTLASPLCMALNKFSVPQFELLLRCATTTQGYDINQLDNYGYTLLEQLFRIPNFTPSIEMIELLIEKFHAEVDTTTHTLAHKKLASFDPKDHQRLFELMGHPDSLPAHQPRKDFKSASAEMIAETNRKLEEAYQENLRKKTPQAEELFTQIKLRLARMTRKMKNNHTLECSPAHELVETARRLAAAEKSGDLTAIKAALAANQKAVNAARVAIEEKAAVRIRRKEIKKLKNSFKENLEIPDLE